MIFQSVFLFISQIPEFDLMDEKETPGPRLW